MKASNINTSSATSLTTLLVPRLSFDPVHVHGLNANVTEEKVSRHRKVEDLHGMMVTVLYLRAPHLEARELAGKAAQPLSQSVSTHTTDFTTQHDHATPELSMHGSIDIHMRMVFLLGESQCARREGSCTCPLHYLAYPAIQGCHVTEVRGTVKRKFDESFNSRPSLPHLLIRYESLDVINTCPSLWASMRPEVLGFGTTATARRTSYRMSFHNSI